MFQVPYDLVLNIDIAPTILDLAGIGTPAHMDGRSILKLLVRKKNQKKNEINWPDTFLVESSGRRDSPLVKKSHQGVKPVEEENSSQPHFYETVSNQSYDNQLESTIFQPISKAERIQLECRKPEFQSPCKISQRWYCTFDGTRWRKHKCKMRPFTVRPNNVCACFNSDGLIYTYSPDQLTSKRVTRDFHRVITSRSKIKRYLPDFKTLEIMLQSAWKNPERKIKRQSPTLMRAQLSSVKDDFQRLISVLQILHDDIHTKCSIDQNSDVSCSNEMYSNPRLWRVSKIKVQKQIRKLMVKLTQLKAIEKHLDQRRPPILPDNSTITLSKSFGHSTDSIRNNKHRHRHENQTKIYNFETNGLFEHNVYSNATRGGHGSYDTRIHSTLSDTCYCADAGQSLSAEKLAAIEKQHKREERLKRKERKLRKKQKLELDCYVEKMNCFSHDNDHWRTTPFWTQGPFCFCMNSNNNSFSCLRTINATHNFLYCEFVTGFVTFYNLRIDPFQQWNRAYSLSEHEKTWLHSSLNSLKICRGSRECHLDSTSSVSSSSINTQGNDSCVDCHLGENKPDLRTIIGSFFS